MKIAILLTLLFLLGNTQAYLRPKESSRRLQKKPTTTKKAVIADFTFTYNGRTVTFDTSSSVSDLSYITEFHFDYDDGSGESTSTEGKQANTDTNYTHRYDSYGIYNVRLTVVDGKGNTNSTTKRVELIDPLHPQLDVIVDGLTIRLDGSGSWSNGTTINLYQWSYGNGMADATSEASHEYTYYGSGDFTVMLTIRDDKLNEATVEKDITVYTPVQAHFSIPSIEPSVVTFDASGTTCENCNIAQYRWEYGDGTIDTTTEAVHGHNYAQGGYFFVKLTAFDEQGNFGNYATSFEL